MNSRHVLDYAVVLVYLIGVAAVGLRVARRKQRTTDDYFLADRQIPAWAVGFAIVGTVISSVSFVAHPGASEQARLPSSRPALRTKARACLY
jgi:solute:Na+ symporter, SSS family